MNIQEYIESGILESFVMGSASDEEVKQLHYYKQQYPEVRNALFELETDMERMAQQMAVTPPPGAWKKIEDNINDLIVPEYEPLKFRKGRDTGSKTNNAAEYIDIETQNTHIRINKMWRWVFAGVFILGKIFLGFAIYFYLENRQAQQQIQELKTELQQHSPR